MAEIDDWAAAAYAAVEACRACLMTIKTELLYNLDHPELVAEVDEIQTALEAIAAPPAP